MPGRPAVLQDRQRVLEALVQVDLLARRPVHVGIGLHSGDELGNAAAGVARLAKQGGEVEAAGEARGMSAKPRRPRRARSGSRSAAAGWRPRGAGAISQASATPWPSSQSASRCSASAASSAFARGADATRGGVLQQAADLRRSVVAASVAGIRRLLHQRVGAALRPVERAHRRSGGVVQLMRQPGGERAERRHLLQIAHQVLGLGRAVDHGAEDRPREDGAAAEQLEEDGLLQADQAAVGLRPAGDRDGIAGEGGDLAQEVRRGAAAGDGFLRALFMYQQKFARDDDEKAASFGALAQQRIARRKPDVLGLQRQPGEPRPALVPAAAAPR